MKKISFLFALLCASVMGWASTQYCGETSPNANFTFSLMNVSGNTYKIQFDAVGDVKFGGAAVNVNCGVNQTAGAGIFFGGDNAANWVFTDDCAYLEFATASESSVPTGFYGNYFCFSKKGGDIIVIEGFNPSDVDWTATCAAVEDNEKPVMGDVSLVKAGGNYAIINVAATDNVGVVKYRAIDLSKEFDGQFTPKDGKITVTGLTPSTAYYLLIYALDAAGNQSELANAVSVTTTAYYTEPQAAATAPTWPAVQVKALYSPTYEADYNHQDWGSGTVYTQDTYGKKYVTNNNAFFGADGFNHNCIAMEKLHYDIWIADDATLRIVPICRNDADTGNEPEVGKFVNLIGQQWNSIDLDLATDYSAVTNWKHVYQVKIDNAKNLTFWVGNAYFYTTVDPTADNQKPTDVTTAVASTDYFSVTLTVSATDNSGSVVYVVKNGETEVATGGGASGESATITVKNLTPATAYTFSVIAKDAAGNEADPVAVPTATTLTLPNVAPAPTVTTANVKSLYSDAYTPATTVTDYRENWWNGASLLQCKLAEEDNVLYYTPQVDGGAHGWAFTEFDATDFNKLHISIYPLNAGTIEIYPVVTGTTEADYHVVSKALTANKWNDVTFDFGELALDKVKQLGWKGYYTLGSFFIDNVYFFKEEGGSAIDTAVETMKAQKLIENGQLIIIKNGIRYNVAGQKVQ